MAQPKFVEHLPAIALGLAALVALSLGALIPKPTYSLGHIERATTPAEHAQGLSGRSDVPADYGMLFVFTKADDYAFWMKDMKVPIDIIWLSNDGVIVGIEPSLATSTFPGTVRPPEPVRYVLETKAGYAAERGWHIGTALKLPL